MNFVIVGCGRVFDYYIRTVLPHLPSSWKLIGLVESDQTKIKSLKYRFNDISIFNSVSQLISSLGSEINIAIILSISGLHYQHALNFLEQLILVETMAQIQVLLQEH